MATRAELATLVSLSTAYINPMATCVAFYAEFIIGEDPNTPLHRDRDAWAKTAIFSPLSVATQIAWKVALDPTFKDVPSPIADWTPILAALPETGPGSMQAAVETAINTTVLQF